MANYFRWMVLNFPSRSFRIWDRYLIGLSTFRLPFVFRHNIIGEHMCRFRGCIVLFSWVRPILVVWIYFSARSSKRSIFQTVSPTMAFVLRSFAVNSDAIGAKFGTNRLRPWHQPLKDRRSVHLLDILGLVIGSVVWFLTLRKPGPKMCPRWWILFVKGTLFQYQCDAGFFKEAKNRSRTVDWPA